MGYKKTANFSLLLLRGQVSTMMSSLARVEIFLRRFIISEKTYDLQCIRILFGLISFLKYEMSKIKTLVTENIFEIFFFNLMS